VRFVGDGPTLACEGLTVQQTAEEFDAMLDRSIAAIAAASST
jgi:hypothetical protein